MRYFGLGEPQAIRVLPPTVGFNGALTMQNKKMMDKSEIIYEIKRIANQNEGKPPGFQKFSNATGIRKADWYPNLWLRWGDALKEAGFAPNKYNEAFDSDFLILKHIELIEELGHFPLSGELRIKKKQDPNFPGHGAFEGMGSKQERAQMILEYCKVNNFKADIIPICEEVLDKLQNDEAPHQINPNEIGFVYLLKHGTRNDYKIGKTLNPLRREGEIRLQLPEKIKPIHYIETDDPAGVEAYWHNRFKDKRKEGEWFSLLADDIKSFKRWKRIV